jgi:hypothetical protein
MSDSEKITVRRVDNVLLSAEDSDFYSSDGKTWDQYADSHYFYKTSDEYKRLILTESQKMEFVPKDEELDFSDTFIEFVLRVEARLEREKNAPLVRNYSTMISYSYEDPESENRVKKYLDLKTLSDYDLENLTDQIPEALKELMYRALISKNNNTNQ